MLKLSPSTAQFMPRNWLVAALAGDAAMTVAATAAGITVSAARAPMRPRRSGRRREVDASPLGSADLWPCWVVKASSFLTGILLPITTRGPEGRNTSATSW
ncbi:hypothetical protein GCM10009682_58430 [Luedemannella flava]|uniref:Uncharacterized protein n=1 Tax=Luedemannella flava TaxID=349316 RepID=A0ABN2MME2_9ACTN